MRAPDDEWIYFCEDDYLHSPEAIKYISNNPVLSIKPNTNAASNTAVPSQEMEGLVKSETDMSPSIEFSSLDAFCMFRVALAEFNWLSFGMDIGGHTLTHPDLTNISLESAKKEINDCRVDLEKKFGTSVNDFCYPFGKFNEVISYLVEDSGYLSATTMLRGKVSSSTDRYLLPRIPINYRTMPHLFLAKIP